MPRIHAKLANCLIHLFPTREDAAAGKRPRGVGFLTCVKSAFDEEWWHPYLITNRSTIDQGNGVVSLNATDGTQDLLELDVTEWTSLPNGDDIAVAPLQPTQQLSDYMFIPGSTFVTKGGVDNDEIGIGDEVFAVGKLIEHRDRLRNIPVMRFGHVTMLAGPVHSKAGHVRECFLVDCPSVAGLSGSPVVLASGKFLGMGCGFLESRMKSGDYSDSGSKSHAVNSLANSADHGLMLVIPAWRVEALLIAPALVAMRCRIDMERRQAPATPMIA